MAYIYQAGTVLNTLLQNLDAVNAYNYRFTYWGFKAFTKIPADGSIPDGSNGAGNGMGAYYRR
jgi:hypothetical protein